MTSGSTQGLECAVGVPQTQKKGILGRDQTSDFGQKDALYQKSTT